MLCISTTTGRSFVLTWRYLFLQIPLARQLTYPFLGRQIAWFATLDLSKGVIRTRELKRHLLLIPYVFGLLGNLINKVSSTGKFPLAYLPVRVHIQGTRWHPTLVSPWKILRICPSLHNYGLAGGVLRVWAREARKLNGT